MRKEEKFIKDPRRDSIAAELADGIGDKPNKRNGLKDKSMWCELKHADVRKRTYYPFHLLLSEDVLETKNLWDQTW